MMSMMSVSWCVVLLFAMVFTFNGCTQLLEFEERMFSQNGEDGVLLHLLDMIGIESKYYVEFGVENGAECNSRVLRERLGFTGLSMDGGFENDQINLQQEFITERNILDLFDKYKVPRRFDVLSLDTDMFDLWILIRLLRDGEYRPRIIVAETNPTLCVANSRLRFEFGECNAVPLSVTHPDLTPGGQEGRWDGTRYAGANPAAFAAVGRMYGYDMLYCESCGVNCFLVQSSELPESCRVNPSYAGPGSPVHVPQVPYPCFGVPGGDGPGHRVDDLRRAAVQLTPDILGQIRASTLTGDALHASRHSCGTGGAAWGADWCALVPVADFSFPQLGFDLPAMITQDASSATETGLTAVSAEAVRWSGLEAEAVRLSALCVTRFKGEAACVLPARLYRNLGVQLLREGGNPATGDAQRPQVLAMAYNHLLRSEELCASCSRAVRGALDLLQYYFAALQARGGLLVSGPAESQRFSLARREVVLAVPVRAAGGGAVQEKELRFHMFDDPAALAADFCAEHIRPVDPVLAGEAWLRCQEELHARVLALAAEEFLPGLAFALTVPEHLRPAEHRCRSPQSGALAEGRPGADRKSVV